ncbi:3-hydroxyacyl-CoA dehydrogenase NAD-binding domain-containing protein [Salsipaludibacter albus]|uniref:3-hydroxyacyl-CoA dehydrogenase NAD-binding domain-containing protein n=1 Tax=Salsipaludibacter albus TaxID=2849650 RepID=UPI001EE3BBE9|nr:3-hydroxyacyl-CoA dehydrogenase NAD-binding domain-containing protein [Salsipaludibacter albus]MBY5161519.1 enoyl-CoA hydratase/isomerase family protein [Salsipaludibacter albus]
MDTTTIAWDRDDAGVVTLTLDDPNQSTNTMNDQFREDLVAVADRLERELDDVTGVVLTSGKPTFFAGGDLRLLVAAGPDDVTQVAANVAAMRDAMRTIETLGVPVVAAINGTALGGGLELALMCHHRVVVDDSGTRLGQPEVTLGLMPGAGGVVRTVRLLGLVPALTEVLTRGQRLRVAKAHELGLVDEVVADPADLLDRARAFITEHPESVQRHDAPGYRIPGGAPSHPKLAATLPAVPATLTSKLKGADVHAPQHILSAAVEGAQVSVDRALEIENRYFVDLVCNSPQSTNMIQAFFFDLQAINKGRSRPDGVERRTASRVAVLGAGMMGAGIAWSCAKAGMDVVLLDTTFDKADHGKDYSRGLADKARDRGRMSADDAEALLDRITPTADAAETAGCDLMIEAVFEDPQVKADIYAAVEPHLADDALLCSNTSTLPITDLAESLQRPEDFLGLHFFSPVDKMPLVEIVRGERTSPEALARAFDVVQQIAKTPIVVNDSRGFFTSRVIGTFLNEAVTAVGEGISPVMVERAGSAAGYPAPPLQLMDELTLTLPRLIEKAAADADAAAGIERERHPAFDVLDRMVEEFDRGGRSSGAGFHDYEDGRRVGLWPGLAEAFGADPDTHRRDDDDALLVDLQERMLFAEALETVKCLDEGVIETFPDANIGSIFGIGFPAWTGGVAQYVDGYPGGTTGFVARCKELADRWGDRFTPPASLVARAEAGEPLRPQDTRGWS